ncbi:MAG: prolyl oligopeptidase family serine peptidase [Phycisphaerales bacterium]
MNTTHLAPWSVSFALLAGTLAPALARAADDQPAARAAVVDEAFLNQWAATNRFRLGQPGAFRVLPDGSGVLFLRASGPRTFVQDLWKFDAATGTERVVLTAEQVLAGAEEKVTAEEQARRERMRMTSRGISGFSVSEDGKRTLVPLSGRLFVVEFGASGEKPTVKELKGAKGVPIDASFSQDGSRVVCVREGEVYITDVATGTERKATSGGGGTVTNGLAEFVAQEEMSRFRGYWLSPDNATLCYQQTDTAGMEQFLIADPLDPGKAGNSWPYPRAGKANAKVKLGLKDAAGAPDSPTTWAAWDSEKYPYLASVVWAKNAPLTILVQNRRQTEQVLLEVDDKTGATRELLRETDPAWINLAHSCPKWLPDGSAFLWMTEQDASGDDGWRLELRDKTGKVQRVLVPGDARVSDSVQLVENGAAVLVSRGSSAAGNELWRYPVDGSAPTRVAGGEGVGSHGASTTLKSSVWVHSFSTLDGAQGWEVRDASGAGKVLGGVKSIAEAPPWLPKVEIVTLSEELDMRAAIVRPRNFDAAKKYPVINSVYGGPGSTQVGASGRGYLLNQWLADQGFVVVTIDARGTPNRGRAWERAINNDVITIPLDDQARATLALARRYPFMDAQRIGIVGWSFGGYFSAHAAMQRPDVFKAGVAGAPVCDWTDYDTHYTERYLGTPQDNPTGYEKTNVLTYCKDLRVPLLIIHGTADDNVYFMHALKMVQALFLAGKDFEFLPLAGYTHVVPNPDVTRNMWRRVALFFGEALK